MSKSSSRRKKIASYYEKRDKGLAKLGFGPPMSVATANCILAAGYKDSFDLLRRYSPHMVIRGVGRKGEKEIFDLILRMI